MARTRKTRGGKAKITGTVPAKPGQLAAMSMDIMASGDNVRLCSYETGVTTKGFAVGSRTTTPNTTPFHLFSHNSG